MYIKLTNNQPKLYSIAELRSDNPKTSFPAVISDAVLAEHNVYPLQATERPEVDHTKNVIEGVPENTNGKWAQVWNIVDASAAEISERTTNQIFLIRVKRNKLLAECDWTQVADSPVDQEAWKAYRKALRDVPEQSGFPWNITWPVKPE